MSCLSPGSDMHVLFLGRRLFDDWLSNPKLSWRLLTYRGDCSLQPVLLSKSKAEFKSGEERCQSVRVLTSPMTWLPGNWLIGYQGIDNCKYLQLRDFSWGACAMCSPTPRLLMFWASTRWLHCSLCTFPVSLKLQQPRWTQQVLSVCWVPGI